MVHRFLGYLVGSKLIIAIICITLILFVAAIIRYLFDRSGGYF